jgi:hypothetical protein
MLQRAKIIIDENQKTKLVANLRTFGYDPNNLSLSDTLFVSKLVMETAKDDQRPNPITASVQRITAQENLLCPICKNKMRDIKIHGGRDAMYCVEHHIALPMEAKQQG